MQVLILSESYVSLFFVNIFLVFTKLDTGFVCVCVQYSTTHGLGQGRVLYLGGVAISNGQGQSLQPTGIM